MVLLLCCVLAAFGLAASPALAVVDPAPGSQRRVASLDGLRGLLAIAVLVHHVALYPAWLRTGKWQPFDRFDTGLGEAAVTLFFMITGYLFWRRLLARHGRVDWTSLYLGRLFRIGPLYMAAAGTAILVSLLATRQLNVSWGTLSREIVQAMAFGMVSLDEVNHYATGLVLAGVSWTLRYEWLFYASLPLLALVARLRLSPRWMLGLVLAAVIVLLAAVPLTGDRAALYFGIGALAASLAPAGWGRLRPRWVGSAVALSCLVLAVGAGFESTHDTVPILLLAATFCLVANGDDLFGLLTLTPLRRLGEISYGLYLLHGLALALLFRPAPLRALVLSGPGGLMLMTVLATLLAVVLAGVGYLAIERPGQRLGRWLDGKRRIGAQPEAVPDAAYGPG